MRGSRSSLIYHLSLSIWHTRARWKEPLDLVQRGGVGSERDGEMVDGSVHVHTGLL